MINKFNMDPLKLEKIISASWIKETSKDYLSWSASKPTIGQSIPTSLVVQDYCGGKIIEAYAILPNKEKTLHYFNSIDNVTYDFTRQQFPKDTKLISKRIGDDEIRNFLLSTSENMKRYSLLKVIVDKTLRQNTIS
jgi:hypothetical protein